MHRTASFLVGLVVVAAACGGSSGSDVNGAATDAGSSSSGAASSGASSSGAASSGGGSSSGASSSGASSSSSGATDGGADGGSAVGNTTTQTCGGAACAIADSVCCVTGDTAKCLPKAQGCGGGGGDTASLTCSGQANCVVGTVCCVHETSNGTASECKAKCADNEAQLCDPNAATTGCAAGVKCSNKDIHDWNLPATFATCGGVGN